MQRADVDRRVCSAYIPAHDELPKAATLCITVGPAADLRRIRGLLYEQGFTIAGAKKALRARGVEPREENDPTLVAGNRAREALVEIRHDVEAFLRELGG